MRKLFNYLFVAFLAISMPLAMTSCEDPNGPNGPEGPEGPQGPEDPKPEGVITADEIAGATVCSTPFQFDYFGDTYQNDGHNYLLTVTTEGCVISPDGASVSGSGEMFTAEINASFQTNFFPAAGKYILASYPTKFDAMEVGTAKAGFFADYFEYEGFIRPEGFPDELWVYKGSFIVPVENGVSGERRYAESGYIKFDGTIDNAELYFHFICDDGSVKRFYYKGSVAVRDCTK